MKDFVSSNKKLLIIFGIVIGLIIIFLFISSSGKNKKLALRCELNYSLDNISDVYSTIEIFDNNEGRKYVEKQKFSFYEGQTDNIELYKNLIFLSLVQKKINDDVSLNFVDENNNGFTSVLEFDLNLIDEIADLKTVYSDINLSNLDLKVYLESRGMKCENF